MAQLHTPAEAAEILRIRESWLRAKAAARAIPCTFIGKHLRFSDDDIAQIMADGRPAAGDPWPRHPAVAAGQAGQPGPRASNEGRSTRR